MVGGESVRCVWLSDYKEGILRGRMPKYYRNVDSANNRLKADSQAVNPHRRHNVGIQTWNKQADASSAVKRYSTYSGDRESYAETRHVT